MKLTIEDNLGVLIVRDRSFACPEVVTDSGRESRAHLKRIAKAGNLFFIDREDPFRMLVQVVVGELSPEDFPTELYQTVAGNYLLDIPSGTLQVQGLDSWVTGDAKSALRIQLEPGAYSVEALEREDRDLTEYEKYMSQLVGSNDWAFRGRVDTLHLIGCLPTVIAIVLAIFSTWKVGLYAALTAAALWLPSLILARSKRYRTIDELIKFTEKNLPLFVLRLRKLKNADGIIGGYIQASG